MKLLLVLALIGCAMAEPAIEKRAVQGIYHYATGPLAFPAPLAVGPAPLPFGPAPIPFAAPVPLPPPALPVPVLPPPVVRVPYPVPVVYRYPPPLVKRYTVRVRNVLPKLRFVW